MVIFMGNEEYYSWMAREWYLKMRIYLAMNRYYLLEDDRLVWIFFQSSLGLLLDPKVWISIDHVRSQKARFVKAWKLSRLSLVGIIFKISLSSEIRRDWLGLSIDIYFPPIQEDINLQGTLFLSILTTLPINLIFF